MSVLVTLLVIAALLAGGFVAYQNGLLDPVIEQIGKMVFKAKAKAEEKQMEHEGEDYVKSELKGNKQASELVEGVGSLGGLKKQL